jgi:hypothetical protein
MKSDDNSGFFIYNEGKIFSMEQVGTKTKTKTVMRDE